MSTMESQNALSYLQAACVCECSLSVSSSLRVFFCRWNTGSKVSTGSLSSSKFILSFLSFWSQSLLYGVASFAAVYSSLIR